MKKTTSEPICYAAFLGSIPKMSLMELAAVIPNFRVRRMVGNHIVLFESGVALSYEDLNAWGGIFLLAEEIKGNYSIADIPKVLLEEVKSVKGKVTFSLRSFSIDRKVMHGLYRDCKKFLKKQGTPSRYIGNEHKFPVAAQLHSTHLLSGKGGREIVLLGNDDEELFWVGKTVAAQDPNAYTHRDMDKPVRDTRSGLLPPKLAQIMLNLGLWAAQKTQGSMPKKPLVYDPFCGTGVIPMEVMLRNFDILASDVSQKAVSGCEKNIDWLRKEKKILKKDVAVTLWKHDATKPFDLKTPPDVIVTETMLGPPVSDRLNAKDANSYKSECETLESAFLANVAATLPGVPVVLTFPVWYLKNGPLQLEKSWKAIEHAGYKAVLPEGIEGDTPGRTSVIYRRNDQFVGREIIVLIPKGAEPEPVAAPRNEEKKAAKAAAPKNSTPAKKKQAAKKSTKPIASKKTAPKKKTAAAKKKPVKKTAKKSAPTKKKAAASKKKVSKKR